MRTFGLACLLALVLPLPGCGNIFIRGDVNNNTQTMSGVVSVVQLAIVTNGNNVEIQVTVVTLVNNFTSTTLTFCGDQQLQFPLNDFAQATFIAGQPCSNLLTVVIKI
jgi:hypothetical protein